MVFFGAAILFWFGAVFHWHGICLLKCTFIEQSKRNSLNPLLLSNREYGELFSDSSEYQKTHHISAYKYFWILIGIKRVRVKIGVRRGKC